MNITLQETLDVLLAADNIIITSHVNPDGDSVGSSWGLAHFLRSRGKKISVMIDDEIPSGLNNLPFVEEILVPEEGQKYQADLLVVLDTTLDRVGRVAEAVQAPVLNIDHHPTNDDQLQPYNHLDNLRVVREVLLL